MPAKSTTPDTVHSLSVHKPASVMELFSIFEKRHHFGTLFFMGMGGFHFTL
jgi:hypothetical protein